MEALDIGIVGPRTPEMEHILSVLREEWVGSSAVRLQAKYRFTPSRGFRKNVAKKGAWRKGRYTSRTGRARAVHYAYAGRTAGAELVLVNALGPDGKTRPDRVARLVRSIRERSSRAAIMVVLDETNPAALRAARQAGATGYLGAREAGNSEAIHWRASDIVRESRKPTAQKVADAPALLPPARMTALAAPSEAEVAAAQMAIERALGSLPSPMERAVRAAEWIRVDVPSLRNPESGRLDAGRIATVLGVRVSRLAGAAGVTQQALSARPDSPKAQSGLQAIARVIAALEEFLPPEHVQMWVNTPLQRFGGETPLAMILDQRAEVLARSIERALDGGSE